MKICPACSAGNGDSSEFCNWCGTKFSRSLVPSVSTSRLPDEHNHDLVSSKNVNQIIITAEDITLIKLFLGKIKDETLSRGIHKVLTDLIGRLS